MKRLTLKAASQHTGVSKSKIWRAVNDGTLKAGKGRTSGGQEAWLVRLDDLEQWTQQHLADSEEVLEDLEIDSESLEEPEVLQGNPSDSDHFDDPFHGSSESSRPIQGPPVELYMAMMDRVTRSERRSVELEIELKKHRLLLTENAESIVQREAQVKESEAKRKEAERLLRERDQERQKALEEANANAERLRLAEELLAKVQAEAQTANEQLKEARSEIDTWKERRSRPWWKKMFSAG